MIAATGFITAILIACAVWLVIALAIFVALIRYARKP